MKDNSGGKSAQDSIPFGEWLMAGIGLVLLCGCLGFLLYKALMIDDEIPIISVHVEQIIPQNGGALVLAEVSNKGGETVTRLQILASTGDEEHEAEIDFLPARSSRKFGVFFSSTPPKNDVKFVAGGYQEP